MEVQIYSCESTFPGHIEGVLTERGYLVEPTPEFHSETNRIHGAFSFRVRKGMGELKVVGSVNNGIFSFHMICENQTDPHSWKAAVEMYHDVEEIMLTNGADLFDIEEL